MAVEKGKFYLTGLGILMEGVSFTEEEKAMLSFLCKHAAESDARYWDAIATIQSDSGARQALERLKKTFRSLDKAPALQAYYDREHRVYS